jgi:hypothetical protein
MLCRYANIPARLVSGFLPGELKDGVYLVREKHKHIWTEVFFPKIGWITFDATEGSEDVTDYNQNQQQQQTGFLQWLKSNGTRIVIGTLIVALLLFVLRNEILNRLSHRKPKIRTLSERPTTNIEIATLYVEQCNRLKRIGLPRPPALTPDEYNRLLTTRLGTLSPELIAAWQDLTALQNRFRYGAETANESDVAAANSAARAIETALKTIDRKALKQALATPTNPQTA